MDNIATREYDIDELLGELDDQEVDAILRDNGINPSKLTDQEVDDVLHYIFSEAIAQEAAGERPATPPIVRGAPKGVSDFEQIADQYANTDLSVRPAVPAVTHPDAVIFMMLSPMEEAPAKLNIYALAADVLRRIRGLGGNVVLYTRIGELYDVSRPFKVVWGDWTSSYILGSKGKNEVWVMRAQDITRGELEYVLMRLVEMLEGHYANSIAVMVAFVSMDEPGPWAPMRSGEMNCFVSAVMPHLAHRKKRRGHKDPVEILHKFGEAHQSTGVDYADLAGLSAPLELQFKFWGWDGELLHTTPDRPGQHKYKVVNLVRHNGHCQDMDAFPEFPRIADRHMVELHSPPTEDEILAVLDELDQCVAQDPPFHHAPPQLNRLNGVPHKALQKLLSLHRDDPGLRLWVVGDEAIASDGAICRPAALTKALVHAEAEERASGESPEILGDRPAELSIGGVLAFRFGVWARRNGLRPVANRLARDMELAQVETPVWNSATEYDAGVHYELDLRAAYLGCEDPALGRTESACVPYLLRYRMPRADAGMKWYGASDLGQVENLPGSFVQFSAWQLRGHGYVLSVIGKHLRDREGILPTPLAIALRDLGHLVSHTLSAVAVSYESAPPLVFLDARASEHNKRLSQRFVGRCAMQPRRSTIFADKAEATFYRNRFVREGRRAMMTPLEIEGASLWCVAYDEGHVQFPHVRAYVLAYMHISVLLKLKEHPDAVRVATDSLTIPGTHQRHPAPNQVKYGVWRVKTNPRRWEAARALEALPSGTAPARDGLPPLVGNGLMENPLIYFDGQGGSGKTVSAIRQLAGRRVAILGKDHIGVLDLEEKVREAGLAGLDVSGHKVSTYHSFWHLGFGGDECEQKPACGSCLACKGWDPSIMGAARRGAGLPECIIWDEVGFVPAKHFRPILEYCKQHSVRVVCCADLLGQIRQFNDREPGEPANHNILIDLGAKIIVQTGDLRARDPDLRDLKCRIWRTDDETQIAETASALRSRKQAGKLADLLAAWTPKDYFAVNTRIQGRAIEGTLLKAHELRFPDEPVPMRLKLSKAQAISLRKGDGRVDVPGDLLETTTVPAIVGTRVWVSLKTALRYLRDPTKDRFWVYDGWRTLHSLQGLTIETPSRLFIIAQGLDGGWNRNACYTAVSRAREMSQLYWVTEF